MAACWARGARPVRRVSSRGGLSWPSAEPRVSPPVRPSMSIQASALSKPPTTRSWPRRSRRSRRRSHFAPTVARVVALFPRASAPTAVAATAPGAPQRPSSTTDAATTQTAEQETLDGLRARIDGFPKKEGTMYCARLHARTVHACTWVTQAVCPVCVAYLHAQLSARRKWKSPRS